MKTTRLAFALFLYLVSTITGEAAENAGIRKLYVEPLTTKASSARLRDELLAELHKLPSVSLVASESDADIILGGGGDVWIKGYRSLNPRSGRPPSGGDPVYTGYLSVELRSTTGETLWSDLVTPGSSDSDVWQTLAKKIVKDVSAALAHTDAPIALVPAHTTKTSLKCAGATFPYSVYTKWFTNYRHQNRNVEIDYSAVGSEAGVRQLLAGSVDFGASDSPNAIHTLAPDQEENYLFFPSVVGAVVPVVNLHGLVGDLSFTPETLAGIYLGRIKKWNDPVLRRANPHLRLPDLDITVVHRSDGSGTSYAFTDFLSKTVPDWKTSVGSDLSPRWPVGKNAPGNDGVASLVKELGGSIGYVEFIYALEKHINFGKVLNHNGEFVEASLESIGIAAKASIDVTDDLKISLTDAPGAGAYPISSFTWIVVPTHIPDAAKHDAIVDFLHWMPGPGQRQAAALGYLALPPDVVAREQTVIQKIQ